MLKISWRLAGFCLLGWVFSPVVGYAQGYGFDVLTPPSGYAEQLGSVGLDARAGTWMRVRGLVDHHRVKETEVRVEGVGKSELRGSGRCLLIDGGGVTSIAIG